MRASELTWVGRGLAFQGRDPGLSMTANPNLASFETLKVLLVVTRRLRASIVLDGDLALGRDNVPLHSLYCNIHTF